MKQAIASWEPQARALLRVVVAYLIFLHGLREVFHILPPRARGPGSFMALDHLGLAGGVVLLAGALLLFLGWFIRPVALIFSIQAVVAYFYASAPRGVWPIRNGGNETLNYVFIFLYLAAAGAGACSVDNLIHRGKSAPVEPAPAAV
ncbi:MAG TPA: DoxX family membrane protein [Bryobacteraceae bacterium]|nr:DoxX family membrane protein [Bryobacteraceae bacterium]